MTRLSKRRSFVPLLPTQAPGNMGATGLGEDEALSKGGSILQTENIGLLFFPSTPSWPLAFFNLYF